MARARKQHDDPGQDSFLDVVANLVGILVILVIVVGARAKNAKVTPVSEEHQTAVAKLKTDIETTKGATNGLERSFKEIQQKVKMQQAAIDTRRAERNYIQTAITIVARDLDEQRKKLGAKDREALELRRDLNAAHARLSEIAQQKSVVENSAAETIAIEHIPTPMAKTVFGKEIHFRLLNGRLAYVPLEELIELMKNEIRLKAEKLRTVSETTETVGPIGGFHLRYKLAIKVSTAETKFGVVQRKGPEFLGFYLRPTGQQLGEPFDQAMLEDSEFMKTLGSLNPDTATITVWVYPDSFNEFLVLKREMFKRGFLTACWPLPEDQPIAGGPNGSRSVAQ